MGALERLPQRFRVCYGSLRNPFYERVKLDGTSAREDALRLTLTRREFLRATGAGLASASLLAGCKRSGVDLREDPGLYKYIAGDEPGFVKRMFDDYVLGDAGGPMPRYWPAAKGRRERSHP
jgi:hypothetical protein